jgi:formylglycine-generating enzyme required for sulfatase activity
MSDQIACPKCAFILQPKTGETTPSHCPACGTLVACPRRGSTVDHHNQLTAPEHYSERHVDFEGAPTRPFQEPRKFDADVSLSLPGFELRGELGRGGMGIVYRAFQRSLNREVAIKVLPPLLALDRHMLERFRNEASIGAALVDSHILPVHDIQDVQGVPVIVMPLIEGGDLSKIIHDRSGAKKGALSADPHPWAALDDRAYLNRILPLLDRVVAAVAALHRRGVLHRDIKPSNVLVDKEGNAWLSDFGLARLQDSSVGTQTGLGMGTLGYASPEQARGEKEIDFRSDVFGLGATLYQSLTLRLPYGPGKLKETSARPSPPSRIQPLLSSDYDTVILKALEIDRTQRYPSSAELQEDWGRVRQGLLPQARLAGPVQRVLRGARRHPWRVLAGLTIAVLAILLATVVLHDPTERRAVQIVTQPPGAQVVLVPLHPDTGTFVEDRLIRARGKTPVTVANVPIGRYLVVVALEGHGFHEVYRTVASHSAFPDGTPQGSWDKRADGTLALHEITIPQSEIVNGMALFEGGDFMMDPERVNQAPPHERTIAPFYLDTTEVTVGAWLQLKGKLPSGMPDGTPQDHAVAYVSYDAAVDYAERMGKRLPDEAEYEFAATMGGKARFPWGDEDKIKEWPLGKVGEPAWDRTPTNPPVFGLFSNVAEWTSSWNWPYPTADTRAHDFYAAPEQSWMRDARIVRGGPWPVVEARERPVKRDASPTWTPRFRHGVTFTLRCPGLGFRCARSAKPRFLKP